MQYNTGTRAQSSREVYTRCLDTFKFLESYQNVSPRHRNAVTTKKRFCLQYNSWETLDQNSVVILLCTILKSWFYLSDFCKMAKHLTVDNVKKHAG